MSGGIFRVGIFLDFARLTTRTPMGYTCGELGETELTPMGGGIERPGRVPWKRCSEYLDAKKSGGAFPVGIFLDFVRLTTHTMHPHGVYMRGAERNRFEPPLGRN